MIENRIFGYSIYRLVGGFDLLLRVWLKPSYDEAVEKILKRFNDFQGGKYDVFRAKRISIFRRSRKIEFSSPDSVYEKMYMCSNSDANIEYENLKTAKLVNSRFHDDKMNLIRLFVAVYFSGRKEDLILDVFLRQYELVLQQDKRVSELSTYLGEGDLGILIKFKLSRFLHYKSICEKLIEANARAKRVEATASFQTFFELDDRGYYESDDGCLIREANEYARNNYNHEQ